MVNRSAAQQVTDPFADTNKELLKSYEEKTAYVALNYVTIVTDVIKLILCTFAVAVDIFLIYVFCKFKKRKRKADRYILHYAICNILYLSLAPVLYMMLNSIYFLRQYSTTPFCIIIQIESLCLALGYLLAFGLGVDWLITCFRPGMGEKCKKVYQFSIPVIYIVGSVKFLVQSSYCFLEIAAIRHILEVVTYGLVLIFILALDCLNYKYKTPVENKKIPYSLCIANIIILSWLPMYIYHMLTKIAPGNDSFELVLWYITFIPEWMAYGNSILIVIVLIKKNKYFKTACFKVFRKSVHNYNNQDNLEENEAGIQRGTQISYNSSTYI